MSFDRREKIIDYLRKNNVVMLKDLEKMFPNVSAMTLRRDLVFFENLGEAVRIRGGARYVKNNTVFLFSIGKVLSNDGDFSSAIWKTNGTFRPVILQVIKRIYYICTVEKINIFPLYN